MVKCNETKKKNPFDYSKSSLFTKLSLTVSIQLPLPLQSADLFEAALHTLQDYDTDRRCSHGAEKPCHRQRTYMAMLPPLSSLLQSGMEFPGDSPFVFQETGDKFGSKAMSQERHAPLLHLDTIHNLGRME